MINKAAREMIGIRVWNPTGKYNVFQDPIVQALGFMEQVRQVLTGKTVHLIDFNAPYQDMIRYFNVVDSDIQTISSDITCFPLLNAEGKDTVAVFIIKDLSGEGGNWLGKQYIKIIGWTIWLK